MKKYIDLLRSKKIPENKGYKCVGSETIFIPLAKIDLSIIKRRTIPVTLVEEIILRIAQCGIVNVDDIAGAMGLDRSIIEITLADLHVKDLAYISSNKCLITGKGRQALRILKMTKREADTMRNVFVITASDTFSLEQSPFKVNSYSQRSHLFEPLQQVDDLAYYRQHLRDIKDVFSESSISATGGEMSITDKSVDELLSIEDIEVKQVFYIQMNVYLFVSDDEKEYDILPKEHRQRNTFNAMRDQMISAINNGRLLSDIFCTAKPVIDPLTRAGYASPIVWLDQMVSVFDKKTAESNNKELEDAFFQPRMLFPSELPSWFTYVSHGSHDVQIWLDNLDSWISDSTFTDLLILIPKKANLFLYYKSCSNNSHAIEKFLASCPNASRSNIVKREHTQIFEAVIDNKLRIYASIEPYYINDLRKYMVSKTYYSELVGTK